jgi:crossover junction endodeoxyribonuclease RuvC
VSTPALRILGIDPGLNRTGFGVIDVHGDRLRFIDAGVIRVPAGELAVRLGVILRELGEVIAEHRPAMAVVEQVFVNVNPKSTLLLGQARGAALCAAVAADLPVHEYAALSIKQAVVGTGRATKAQVQMMITRLLSLAVAPPPDAADALACAVCHAHARRLAAQMHVHSGPTATARTGAQQHVQARTAAGAGTARRGRAAARSAWAQHAALLGK